SCNPTENVRKLLVPHQLPGMSIEPDHRQDLVHLSTRLETFPTTVCEDGTDHDHVLNGAHLLCEELPGLFRRTAHEIPQCLTGVHKGGLHPEGSPVGLDQTHLFSHRRRLFTSVG